MLGWPDAADHAATKLNASVDPITAPAMPNDTLTRSGPGRTEKLDRAHQSSAAAPQASRASSTSNPLSTFMTPSTSSRAKAIWNARSRRRPR